MAHAYVQFRRRLAVHAMRQFAASLKSSGEILLLVFSNVLVGLVALVALPPAWAACQSALLALPLLCAHALVMTLPLVLLRKRVLPLDVVLWQHRLPIPPATRLMADALVAGLLVGPLALLYAVSLTVWLMQRPDWLTPARATLGTLFSLLLTYASSVAVLALRSRMPGGRGRWQARWQQRIAEPAPAYAKKARAPRSVLLWHRLHWLPYWRAESVVGWQQTMLLVAAAGAALPWTQAPQGIARGVLALATCILMVVLTDRGDKAVREQIARLRPVMASWPIERRPVELAARAFTVLPALLVLALVFAGGLAHGHWQRPAGRVWLSLSCVAQLLLVATPPFSARGRVGLVVVAILILTAVGSEI